ncbi:cytochrome c3 family protein [Desulfomarina sp.]
MNNVFLMIAGCLLTGLFSALPLPAANRPDPPEAIVLNTLSELYQPVVFDHLSHQDNYNCNTCHHHTAGTGAATDFCGKCHDHSPPRQELSCAGCHLPLSHPISSTEAEKIPFYHIDILSLKSALHLQCIGCHQDEDGPDGCLDCHAFTRKGKKRFQITGNDS